MPLSVSHIPDHAHALVAGLREGDRILSVNGHDIDHELDLMFYSHARRLRIRLMRYGEPLLLTMKAKPGLFEGVQFMDVRIRTCCNDCVFCFVDQMPPDVRDSLALKDDDYRQSFLHGNFITLTNLASKDWQKIVDMRLSPLYISIHTTEGLLHRKMLRYPQEFDPIRQLRYLSDNKIDMHTQIVVVPEWNDGKHLEQSLGDLLSVETVRSVGIVPVGLTRWRDGLTPVRAVNKDDAVAILEIAGRFDSSYPGRIFCADEIYLLAEEDIPPDDFYGDYPQIENGIGMLRTTLDNLERGRTFLEGLIRATGKSLLWVTGTTAALALASVLGNGHRVQPVVNRFLGESVTVAGLLAGRDIIAQVHPRDNEMPVLPASILNADGLTLDDIPAEELSAALGGRILFLDPLLESHESKWVQAPSADI